MRFRPLGRSSADGLPDVSAIALGTMSVARGSMHANVDADLATQTIRAAVELGINLFDTAPAYGDGESESRLGDALADAGAPRDRLVLATKACGPTLSRAEIVADCEASLKRLRTDYIDLYQIHWRKNVAPLAETFDAMAQLKRDGKVRSIGVCNFGPQDLADAWTVGAAPVSDQVVYSLLSRGAEFALTALCEQKKLGLLCYSPLAQGLLTKRHVSADSMPRDRCRSRHFVGTRPNSRHGEPGCEPELFDAIAKVAGVADALGCTMSELSIAWLLHQPTVTSVLCGASSPEQVQANVKALDRKLSAEVLHQLDAATSQVKSHLGDNLDMWQGSGNSRIH